MDLKEINNYGIERYCKYDAKDDYKERFKAEYIQEKIRAVKLENILKAYKDNKLNYKLKCPYELLYEQLVFMKNKLRILSERAKIEGIELIMDLKRG